MLYSNEFAMSGDRHSIYVGDDVFNISRFLLLPEINSLIDEFYNILGYDRIRAVILKKSIVYIIPEEFIQ